MMKQEATSTSRSTTAGGPPAVAPPPYTASATNLEIARAVRIKRAAILDPDVNADKICDLEFLQYAIVAKDDMAQALRRIQRMQRFKQRNGIQRDGSYEQAMRDISMFQTLHPDFFLSLAESPVDGVHILSANYAKFRAFRMTTEEAQVVRIRGLFYYFQACQPHVDAMRAGYVSLADTIAGFKGIIDGEYDHLPEQAFYMVGNIEEAVEKAKDL